MRPTPLCPTPKWESGRNAKLPTKTKRRGGTPRGATEPDGAPKFGYPALESAIFWWIPPKLSNILCARRPLFPTPKWERQRNAQLPTKQRAPRSTAVRHGTLRNLKGLLNLAIPHCNPPFYGGPPAELSNILCAQRPLFPTPKCGRMWNSKLQTKKRRGGRPRHAMRRLNMPTPHWSPPY